MNTIADRVKAIIADELGVDVGEVIDEARLGEQLGADSLDAIHVTLALEDEFGIEIPDVDALELQTVGDVVRYIKTHIRKPAASA